MIFSRFTSVISALVALMILSPKGAALAAELDITLQKIVSAPRQYDYEGVLTTQTYGEADAPESNSQHILHQKPNRNRIDTLVPQSKARMTVIQVGDDVFRRESDGDDAYYAHRKIRGESGLGLGLGFSSIDLLETNYELLIQGSEVFLNRPSVILTLKPNHPGRMSKTAWVDTATGLVLRTEDRDGYGNLLGETFFSSLSVNPKVDESLFGTEEWTDRAVEENEVIACGSLQEVEERAGFPLAAPVYMPAGFTLDRLRVILYANQPTAHFTYTDGLAQISLYQRAAARSDSAAMAWPGGTPHVQDNIQVWDRGPSSYILRNSDDTRLFTMVSEISEEESIDMIRSLCVINPPESAAHTASIDLLLFAGGGLLVGSVVLGGWFLGRRRTLY